jgi:hypothetical protein
LAGAIALDQFQFQIHAVRQELIVYDGGLDAGTRSNNQSAIGVRLFILCRKAECLEPPQKLFESH